MEFILSGFILIIFVVSLSSLGYFFLNDDSTLNNSKSLHLLFGLSVLLLFSHFSFYLFKLNSLEILIIFLIFSFISIILNLINKKDFKIYQINRFVLSTSCFSLSNTCLSLW